MPRKWRQSDFDDDGYGAYDEEDYYDEDEEYAENNPSSSLSVAGGHFQSSVPIQLPIVAQTEEPGVEEGFWGCQVCTFDNPPDSLTCDICDTPREEVSAVASDTASSLKETELSIESGSFHIRNEIKRTVAVRMHHQETMVEQEEINILACSMQSRESRKVSEDAVREIIQDCVRESDGKPICISAKWHAVVRRYRFPSMVKSFTNSDPVNWMRHGGPGRGFLIAAVGSAALVAVTSVIALALLFVFSTLNAAFASFFVTFSTVCFIMAFFFSSVTVVYVGALGFGGLTIGSIAFFSVWAVIILSGWVAIAWIIWQGLRKAFQFGKHLAFLSGSFLLSFPAAQKLKLFGVKIKEYRNFPQMSETMAMD